MDENNSYITRSELAIAMNVSIDRIKSLEFRRKFSGPSIPAKGGRGEQPRYSPEKVLELRNLLKSGRNPLTEVAALSLKSYTPEEGKKAFVLLKEGKPAVDLITELGIHPHSVRAIVADYNELAGGFFLSAKTLEQIHKLPLDGCFPLEDENALLELLMECSSDTCFVCKKRSKAVCSQCSEARR